MNRLLLSILLLIIISFQGFSQLSGGFKGGLNISNIIITNSANIFDKSDISSLYTYHFGSYVKNQVSDHFAWKIEMLFSVKGYKLKAIDQEDIISLNYLDWPLLLVYQVNKRIGIEAGLEPGFLVSGESMFRNFDLGMDVGASYNLSKKWHVGLRYNQGLPFELSISDLPANEEAPRYQHSVIQFYFGFNLVRETTEQTVQ